MAKTRLLLPLVLLASLSAACGGSSADTAGSGGAEPVSSATAAAAPICDEVIKDGAPSTKAFLDTGCSTAGGSLFFFDPVPCKDGRTFVVYDDRFRTFLGETWKPGGDPVSAVVAKDLAACRG